MDGWDTVQKFPWEVVGTGLMGLAVSSVQGGSHGNEHGDMSGFLHEETPHARHSICLQAETHDERLVRSLDRVYASSFVRRLRQLLKVRR